MTDYNTKAKTIGGVTITVSKEVGTTAGDRLEALLKFIAKWVHGGKPPEGGIDNELPGTPPAPDQGLPGSGGRPDNTLPGGGGGGRPDNTLPGGGGGGRPDNSLPGEWLGSHAKEIAKAILDHCYNCNTAQPK